jgi:hypothetical protein
MLRRALLFLSFAGCATEPAVEPVTPAPPTVVVHDERQKQPTPDEQAIEPTPDESKPIRNDSGESGTVDSSLGVGNIGTIGKGGGTGSGQGFGLGSGRLGRTNQGAMNVQGSLDKETIRRVIQRELAAIRGCYERELIKRPNLAGRIAVRFTIAPAGHVSDANAETSLDPNVDTCVVTVFKRLTFPKPDGGPVVVRYPLIFQTTETK